MYTELSQEQQIKLFANLVPDFLAQYDLAGSTFKNVNHGFNSSFKVDAPDGQTYALRINSNSKKSASEVDGEVLLLEYLFENQIVTSPRPKRTTNHKTFATVYADFLGRDIYSVLNYWIDGEEIGLDASDTELYQLGVAMAKLHQCAPSIPKNIVNAFPKIDRTLFNSPDNLRKDDPRLDSHMRDLIDRAFEVSESVFAKLAKQSNPILIHADLHPHNALKTSNGLAIIDFDDVGIGYELQDMAITFFYLRDKPGKEEIVLNGYQSVSKLPEYSSEDLEALLVARQLLLLNDLLDVTTAEEIASTPEYIEISRLRLKHYLETGRFELIRRLS